MIMHLRQGGIAFGIAALLAPGSASAASVAYTDRPTFLAAAGSVVVENFDAFAADTSFDAAPLDVGAFVLSISAPAGFDNLVDVPPLISGESDVNGTANARVFTALGRSFFVTFDAAVTAFGADFRNLNDTIERTDIIINGELFTPPVVEPGDASFFGLVSDTPFTTVEFRGRENDVFGLDNATFTAAEVPAPAAIALFGLGIAGAAFARRRR